MIKEYWIIQELRGNTPYKSRSYRTEKTYKSALRNRYIRTWDDWRIQIFYTSIEQPLILIAVAENDEQVKSLLV